MKAHLNAKNNLFYVAASMSLMNRFKFLPNLKLIFDTGAADTIISTSSLYTSRMCAEADKLEWDSACSRRILAKSAFGDSYYAYRVCLNRIRLSGAVLDNFYCYLVPDASVSVALLGNDFLNYCRYSHDNMGRDIDFHLDKDAYEASFSPSECSPRLMSLLNAVQIPDKDCSKSMAAAVRKPYKG